MRFSEKQGMARYMRWYYLVPMYTLSSIAIISGIIYSYKTAGPISMVGILFGVISIIITLVVHMLTRKKDIFYEIAAEFEDDDFTNYLSKGNYSEVLRRH